MNNRTCLVTGASSGIGKEIALGLARLGAEVILVCRNANKGEAALDEIKALSGSNKIHLFISDLSSQADIRSLASSIYSRFSALHVLINNAGVVLTEKKYSVDGIEMTLATNHLAPFLLTHLLLDLLKAGAPSRIINVSSAIHHWGKIDFNDLQFEKRNYRFMRAYAQSKLLMNITTVEMARRLEGTGITVNSLHPGAVKTNLGSDNAASLSWKIVDKVVKFFFISPATAAKTPLYLATSPDLEKVTGKYFVRCKPASQKRVTDEISKKVWEISEEGVKFSRNR
jgi:NAD(P)-dependent dehydrogenase (short-subunit alcohol dehydrogenase family)